MLNFNKKWTDSKYYLHLKTDINLDLLNQCLSSKLILMVKKSKIALQSVKKI